MFDMLCLGDLVLLQDIDCSDPLNNGIEECKEFYQDFFQSTISSRIKGTKPPDAEATGSFDAVIWNLSDETLEVYFMDGEKGIHSGDVKPIDGYRTNTWQEHTFKFVR